MVQVDRKPSLYDVLGLTPTAPPEAVRKAYKRILLETHPDKVPLDATDEEKVAAEQRFREVYQAFEILGDPAKRRVYDNGLNYLRGRTRMEEMQAKLAREREEWDRQCKARQEERLAAMQSRMRARQEAEATRREELRREYDDAERPLEDKRHALREELRRIQEREREILGRTQAKLQEKIATLQEVVKLKRAESIRSMRSARSVQSARRTLCAPSRRESTASILLKAHEMLRADELLRALRAANPELEARRQAALQRKSQRSSMCDTVSIVSKTFEVGV
ncbi:DnaJ-domain-containing protein [Phanerochaete sordida]|uniref:DnaJ-domain-containing protein n=1 Tax=Phanerochaete sordida TaxID=48140 RepID=A0A9P3GB03_9APHY|nr:DnaJ-domain-containing protein [Phanerochaete sordida]